MITSYWMAEYTDTIHVLHVKISNVSLQKYRSLLFTFCKADSRCFLFCMPTYAQGQA